MALYLLTIKKSETRNGVRLEKGMTVEVASNANPLSNSTEKAKSKDAFNRKYGIDLEKAGALNSSFIEIKKIN